MNTPKQLRARAVRQSQFCKALNRAAATLQRDTHNPAAVLAIAREQIIALGLHGILLLLDETGNNLVIQTLAQPARVEQIVEHIKLEFGINVLGFTFPRASSPVLQRVIVHGKAVWAANSWRNIAPLVPADMQAISRPLQRAYANHPGIYAPLFLAGTAKGILIVSAARLRRSDTAMIQAFANHIAIALENARLYASLRENEERFRALFEQGSDLLFLLDAGGVIRYASPSAGRVLGYTAQQAIGKNWFEFIHPDDHARTANAFHHRLAHPGAADTSLETRVRHSDGTWRVLEAIGNNLLHNPAINGIIVTCRDITDRAHAEESSRLNQARLNAAFENLPFDFWVCDRDGRYIAQNAKSVQNWGNLIGKHPRELDMPNAITATWIESNARALGGEVVTHEITHTLGGVPRTFVKTVAPVLTGDEIQGTLGVNIDITERKHAEDTVRAREKHLAQINEITRAALTTQDFTTMAQTLADQLGAMFAADEAFITRWDSQRSMPVPVAAFGPQRETYRQLLVHADEPSLTAAVLQAEHPIVVEDVFQSPLVSQRISRQLPTRAMLGLPLIAGTQKIGAAIIGYDQFHHFSDDAIARAEQVTHLLALALAQVQSLEQARARAAELETVRQASMSLTSSLDLKTVLAAILDGVLQLADDANDTHVFLYADDRLAFGAARYTDSLRDTPWSEPRQDGITYTVARQGEPIIIGNTSNHPLYAGTTADWGGSIISLPLKIGARVVGVMNVAYWQPREFDTAFVRTLQLLGDQAALAIENARLYQAARARAAELEVLRQAALNLTSTLALPRVLDSILDSAFRLMPQIEDAHIFLYQENVLKFGAAHTQAGKQTQPFAEPRHDGLTWTVARCGEMIVVPDQRTHPLFANAPTAWRGAIIGLPLKIGAQVVGVMNIAYTEPRAFVESEMQILRLLGDQAALAIQNARLFEAEREARIQSDTLRQAAHAISSTLKRPEILHRVLTQLQRVIPCTTTSVLLYDHTGLPELIAGLGYADELITTQASKTLLKDSRILARMTHNLQPVLIPDVRIHPDWVWVPGAEHVVAFLAVPILAQEKLMGVLFLDRATPNAFSANETLLAQTFAQHLAVPLENAHLFEQAEQRAREFAALYETARDLSGETDMPRLLKMIIERASSTLGAQDGVIYLYDAEHDELITAANAGLPFTLGTRLDTTQGASGMVVRTRQPIVIEDYQNWEHRRREYDKGRVGAVAQVPILYGDELIGVLGIAELTPSTRKFSNDDVRLLTLFASQAANAIHTARLLAETRQRAEQLEWLYHAGLALNRILDSRAQLQTLLESTRQALHADRVEFSCWDPHTNRIHVQIGLGYPEEIQKQLSTYSFSTNAEDNISGWVFQHRQSRILPDVSADPTFIPIDPTVRSGIWTPIEHENNFLGTLVLFSTRVNAFTASDEKLAALFASQFAIAMENARLFKETQRRLNELEAVNRISATLRATETIDAMVPLLLHETATALDAEHCSLWLYDPTRDILYQHNVYGYVPANYVVKPGEGIAGTVFQSGKPHISPEFKTDPLTVESARLNLVAGANGACVPVRAGTEIIGVMFASVNAPHVFGADHIRLLTTLAEIAGNAIHRMRLHTQTTRRANELAVVNQLGHELGAEQHLDMIYARTANAALETLPDISTVVISLFDPGQDRVTCAYGIKNGKPIDMAAFAPFPLESPEHDAQAQAIRMRRSVIVNNATAGLRRTSIVLEHGTPLPQSVVHVPLLAQESVMGVIQVHSDKPNRFTIADAELLELIAHPAASAIETARLFAQLHEAYDETIEGWARALDLRDRETEGHTRRVVTKSVQLARAIGVSEEQITHIRRGALLHDIGKMGIPDAILLKPGPLTESEWETMRMHPAYAYALLSSIEYLQDALDIPYCHHEKWDGTGYPRRLQEQAIPLAARLFSIVDVWDALCSNRTYRAAWPREKALAYLREHSGTFFDPDIVQIFLSLRHEPD